MQGVDFQPSSPSPIPGIPSPTLVQGIGHRRPHSSLSSISCLPCLCFCPDLLICLPPLPSPAKNGRLHFDLLKERPSPRVRWALQQPVWVRALPFPQKPSPPCVRSHQDVSLGVQVIRLLCLRPTTHSLCTLSVFERSPCISLSLYRLRYYPGSIE